MKKIIEFTENIEKKAKMKELNVAYGQGIADSELDALYLQAIEAKLGLLEKYWQIYWIFLHNIYENMKNIFDVIIIMDQAEINSMIWSNFILSLGLNLLKIKKRSLLR